MKICSRGNRQLHLYVESPALESQVLKAPVPRTRLSGAPRLGVVGLNLSDERGKSQVSVQTIEVRVGANAVPGIREQPMIDGIAQ